MQLMQVLHIVRLEAAERLEAEQKAALREFLLGAAAGRAGGARGGADRDGGDGCDDLGASVRGLGHLHLLCGLDLHIGLHLWGIGERGRGRVEETSE